MIRRSFLRPLAAFPFFATAASVPAATATLKLKILMKSAWGSDDPTKAAFPFLHADALSEAGPDLPSRRRGILDAEVGGQCSGPVGWPPLAEILGEIIAKKIPIYACGACSRARGVTETDLAEYAANSAILKSLSR
jgi:predicted peroxiredoxin